MFTVTTFVRVVFSFFIGLSFPLLSLAKNQVYTVFYKYNYWDFPSTSCTSLKSSHEICEYASKTNLENFYILVYTACRWAHPPPFFHFILFYFIYLLYSI